MDERSESEKLDKESVSEDDILNRPIVFSKDTNQNKTPFPDKQKKQPYIYHHHSTLAATDSSPNSTGYMKYVSEYKRNYFKQPNVENFVPQLNVQISKLFSDIKDSAQLPRPPLVIPPYASMNIDTLPLSTKKKLFQHYYSSVKTYYMEDAVLFKEKEKPSNVLKTLEDIYYEKEKTGIKSSCADMNTRDEVEAIAKMFYKSNSEIRQLTGLKREILRLLTLKRFKKNKIEIEKVEEEIEKKVDRNIELLRESKLRVPYKKEFGFTGYSPRQATHDEVAKGSKYSSYTTINDLIAEQQSRRSNLAKYAAGINIQEPKQSPFV